MKDLFEEQKIKQLINIIGAALNPQSIAEELRQAENEANIKAIESKYNDEKQ